MVVRQMGLQMVDEEERNEGKIRQTNRIHIDKWTDAGRDERKNIMCKQDAQGGIKMEGQILSTDKALNGTKVLTIYSFRP